MKICLWLFLTFTLTSFACDEHFKEAQEFQQDLNTIQKSFEVLKKGVSEAKPIYQTETFTVSMPAPHVYFLRFIDQTEAGLSFVRFQEHYENPKFRNTIFSLEEFKVWYIENYGKEGKFTYPTDWAGYNFPSTNLEPFFDGSFQNISKREQAVLDFFEPMRGTKFYVIAGSVAAKPPATMSVEEARAYSEHRKRREIETVRHEVAHSLYFMDEMYKAKVDDILDRADPKALAVIRQALLDNMYDEAVIRDEQHAYLGTNWTRYVLSTNPAKKLPLESIRQTIWELNLALEEALGLF